MQRFGLVFWILTLLIVALALAGAFPEKVEVRDCADYKIVDNPPKYSCQVTEAYYKDGWLIKAPGRGNAQR